jgi:hypothetical protein
MNAPTMSQDASTLTESPNRPTLSPRPVGWLMLLAIAWIVWEITHSPGLAAFFISLKFSLEDFLTARWIWCSDPHLQRRRAFFWLYASWGLWKSAIVAFAMCVTLAALVNPRAQPGDLLATFLASFLTTLVTLSLSVLMFLLAILFSRIANIRLWLDAGVHRARRFDFWPPTPFCIGRVNRISHLAATLVGVGFVVVLIFLVRILPENGIGNIAAFILTLSAPVTLLMAHEALLVVLRAESPEEAWPEEWDDEKQNEDR